MTKSIAQPKSVSLAAKPQSVSLACKGIKLSFGRNTVLRGVDIEA